jgi:hypothetical protein
MLRKIIIALFAIAALGLVSPSIAFAAGGSSFHGGGHGGGWHGGGGHGGGYRGDWGGGGWGWGGGWGPDWGPDYYYDEPGDCGWVRVPVLRHGHRVVQRVWRCW